MHCGGGQASTCACGGGGGGSGGGGGDVVHVFVQYELIGCSDALIVAGNQRNTRETVLRPLCNCEG